MNAEARIRTGQSSAADSRAAVAEFHAQVAQPDTGLVIFFCSSAYDRAVLSEEINHRFAGIEVVGCTTAGEIGPTGYVGHSLAGASIPRGAAAAVAGRLGELQQFEMARGNAFAQSLLRELEARVPQAGADNSFALLLIDGLSMREEPVTHTLQDALGKIRMIGGSAGDDLKFERTWVFHGGAFHGDSAVLTLLSTPLPFRTFKTQHFVSDAERLVVTAADVAHRVVYEINGLPAAEEYSRLVGVPLAELGPDHFAVAPVVVMIDGTDYVRSIQKANPDGSLTFYCAIDEGLVLRVAHGENLVKGLEDAFAALQAEIGPPQLVLACDCILRNLEISRCGLTAAVGEVFRRNHAVGFSTYGEQYAGVHVNQTLTGVAIGSGTGRDG